MGSIFVLALAIVIAAVIVARSCLGKSGDAQEERYWREKHGSD